MPTGYSTAVLSITIVYSRGWINGPILDRSRRFVSSFHVGHGFKRSGFVFFDFFDLSKGTKANKFFSIY